jgi:hypothetical protein
VGCPNQNSQRSPRCHLSEMDLTRQRLVTFLRGEKCAGVLQAGLRHLVGLSDRSLSDGGLCICSRRSRSERGKSMTRIGIRCANYPRAQTCSRDRA